MKGMTHEETRQAWADALVQSNGCLPCAARRRGLTAETKANIPREARSFVKVGVHQHGQVPTRHPATLAKDFEAAGFNCAELGRRYGISHQRAHCLVQRDILGRYNGQGKVVAR